MKRNVLFIGYDVLLQPEIEEYLKGHSAAAYFALTNEQAIRTLDEIPIHKIVLNLRSLQDAVILRYVNMYHHNIQVVVSANREFDEVISIFNRTAYERLPRPFRLEELGTVL